MSCPPEIAEIVAEILATALLRIRNRAACQTNRCAVEADHIHNLPNILVDYKPELLDYYWSVERVAFLQNSANDQITDFEPLWAALSEHVTVADEAAPVR